MFCGHNIIISISSLGPTPLHSKLLNLNWGRQAIYLIIQDWGAFYWKSISRGSVSKRMPIRISFMRSRERMPIFSFKSLLFTVKICEIFTTLFFFRFASPLPKRTLPGAFARFKFDVRDATTTVLMRLRLNRLFCITTWGCR